MRPATEEQALLSCPCALDEAKVIVTFRPWRLRRGVKLQVSEGVVAAKRR